MASQISQPQNFPSANNSQKSIKSKEGIRHKSNQSSANNQLQFQSVNNNPSLNYLNGILGSIDLNKKEFGVKQHQSHNSMNNLDKQSQNFVALNKIKSSEGSQSMNGINNEQMNSYSTNDHSKFIDKVWDSFRFQANHYNSITAHLYKNNSSQTQTTQQPLKLPPSPFKNLKDALRQYMLFNQKAMSSLDQSLVEQSRLKDRDERVKLINTLQEKLESYEILFEQQSDKESLQDNYITDNQLQEIQESLKEKQKQRQYELSDAQLRLECQSKIISELMRDQDQLKNDYQYNKSLLAQSQAQLKQTLGIAQTDLDHLNTSDDINLGDSRLDSNLHNQDQLEIENVVMLQQTTQVNGTSTGIVNFQRQYLNNNLTQSDNQGSPLPRDYLFKSTMNEQAITDSKIREIKFENETLKKKLEDYQINFIRKDVLCQLVDKLQSTFQSIEFDASSLKDLINSLNNQQFNSNSSFEYSQTNQSFSKQQQYHDQSNNYLQQQLNDNFDLLSQRIQNALALNIQESHNQNEILDLKTEICQLKQKLLQADQKRVEDLNLKNIFIQKLEQSLHEEQRRRIEEMDEKEKKIEEMEKEIELTISQQMNENQELRDRNSMQQVQLAKFNEIERDILRFYGDRYDINFRTGDLTSMVQRVVKDNENLKEEIEQKQDTINQIRNEDHSKQKELELKLMEQKRMIEQDQTKIIRDMSYSHNELIKQKDREISSLKNKLSSQIDQISLSLDDNLAQNQELHSQIISMKQELQNKEMKEKQLLTKIMKLRDDRSNYRQQQVKQNQGMLEQQEIINQMRDLLDLNSIQISNQFATIDRKFDTNKILQDQGQVIKTSLEEIVNSIQELKQAKAKKITRNQNIQVHFQEQDQTQLKVETVKQTDHVLYYEEILRLLRQQQSNSKNDQDFEIASYINQKLDELHKTIQQRDMNLLKSPMNKLNHMSTIESNNFLGLNHQGEVVNQDGTTPRINKNLSFLQNSNQNTYKYQQINPPSSRGTNMPLSHINVQQIYQELESDDNYDQPIQRSNRQQQQSANQSHLVHKAQEGLENHEELGNSKFWFDMYQRIKKEISKERKQTLEAQSKLQQIEDELYQLKQKVYLIQNENATLEQLNSQYLQQIQEIKGQINLKDKNKQIKDLLVIDQVIEELNQVAKSLKGDFMNQVIHNICNIKDRYQDNDIQNDNHYENYLGNVTYELLNIFKILLKQLQQTQKQLNLTYDKQERYRGAIGQICEIYRQANIEIPNPAQTDLYSSLIESKYLQAARVQAPQIPPLLMSTNYQLQIREINFALQYQLRQLQLSQILIQYNLSEEEQFSGNFMFVKLLHNIKRQILINSRTLNKNIKYGFWPGSSYFTSRFFHDDHRL